MRVRWISGVVVDTTSVPGRRMRIPVVLLVPGVVARWHAPSDDETDGRQFFVGAAEVTSKQLLALHEVARARRVAFTVLTEPTRQLTTLERGTLSGYVTATPGETEDAFVEKCVQAVAPRGTLAELEAGLESKLQRVAVVRRV